MGAVHIPIIDEDKLDDIITALQALAAPSGTNVAISPTGMHIVTEDDVQGAISELDSAVDSVNSSLTNYTTYATTADEIVIGKKDGKTLYRKYVSASNLTVAVNTEFVIANSVLPNNATNVSISDKSRVYASAIDTSMGANSMYWIVYAVGQSIRGRQGYSSSTSWNVDVWVEYTKG